MTPALPSCSGYARVPFKGKSWGPDRTGLKAGYDRATPRPRKGNYRGELDERMRILWSQAASLISLLAISTSPVFFRPSTGAARL